MNLFLVGLSAGLLVHQPDVAAQTSDGTVITDQQQGSAIAAPRALRYRDAAGTFEVEQIQSPAQGTYQARLFDRQHDRSWPVVIDQHAIVQVPTDRPADAILASLGLRPVAALMPSIGLWRVVDANGTDDGVELAARLQPAVSEGVLRQATPDFQMERQRSDINIPPNDPRYDGQWYLERMAIESAWRIADGDANTTIIVVDNGCDTQHPDLVDNLAPGLDVIDNDNDPQFAPSIAGNEHGTACAGIAAASGDNNVGIAGVCPECQLRCVRLLGALTPVSADVTALRFALDVDAAVVSNSWSYVNGAPAPGPVVEAIAEIQRDGRSGLGTVMVFAAGNENRELTDGELATLPGVITVGAINNFDEATAFSNRGDTIDLVAPAATFTTDIVGADGADPGDYNSRFGGTSAATPIVAGVVGLLASADPSATADEIRSAILGSLRPAPFAQPGPDGQDPQYGGGIVDPEAALRRLLDLPAASPDAGIAEDAGVNGDTGADTQAPSESGCATVRAPLQRNPYAWGWLVALFLWSATRVTSGRISRPRR